MTAISLIKELIWLVIENPKFAAAPVFFNTMTGDEPVSLVSPIEKKDSDVWLDHDGYYTSRYDDEAVKVISIVRLV